MKKSFKFSWLLISISLIISLFLPSAFASDKHKFVWNVDENGNGSYYFPIPPKLQSAKQRDQDACLLYASACVSSLTYPNRSFSKILQNFRQNNVRSGYPENFMAWGPLSAESINLDFLRGEVFSWTRDEFTGHLSQYLREQIEYALIQSAGFYQDETMNMIFHNKLNTLLADWFESGRLPLPINHIIRYRTLQNNGEIVSFIDFIESELNRNMFFTPQPGTSAHNAFRNALDFRLRNLPLRLQAHQIQRQLVAIASEPNPIMVKLWFTGLQHPGCLGSLPISTKTSVAGPQARFRLADHFVALNGGTMRHWEVESLRFHDTNPQNADGKRYPLCTSQMKVVVKKDGSREIEGEGIESYDEISPNDLAHLMIGNTNTKKPVHFIAMFL